MNEEYHLHSRPVKPEPLIEAVIGLAHSPKPLTGEEVSNIIDMSGPYTGAVLQLGVELGLLVNSDGSYVVASKIREDARRMTPEQGSLLLSRYAQRYDPFMTFVSFLNKGFNSKRSAKSVKTLYGIDTAVEVIEKQFIRIGVSTDILTNTDGVSVVIEFDTLPSTYLEDLQEALRSEAKARLYIHDRLGDEIIAYADEESIDKFQEALLLYSNSPANAIVNTVVGAENITRELAEEEGDPATDYSSANGIGSLANLMRSDGLILKRHLHAANYLGAMRIPGAHGKESETLEMWVVEPEVSLEVLVSSLSYVHSLYFCIKEGRQVL